MKLTKNQIIILVIVLIIGAFLTYLPHLNYPYPLHVDEWASINQARELTNPRYVSPTQTHTIFTLGFTAIIMILEVFLNIVLIYKFLPIITFIVSAIILFKFTHQLTKNYSVAIFSVIFLLSLPNNTNLLGSWFFVPFIASIPLVFLTFFLYLKAYNKPNKKLTIYSIISLLALLLIYPPYAIFTFLILAIYTFLNKKTVSLKKIKKPLIIFSSILTLLIILIMLVFSKSPYWILSQLYFPQGHSSLDPGINTNAYELIFLNMRLLVNPYFLPILFGIIPFVLAIIGIYKSYKSNPKNILIIWFITSVAFISLFLIFNFTFIMSYQRIVYMALLALVPFTGIGASTILSYAKRYPNYIFLSLIILILIVTFYNYGKPIQGTEIYHLIDEQEYQEIIYLNQYDTSYIITDLEKSLPILVLTSHKPTAGFIGTNTTNQQETKDFLGGDCNFKEDYLKKKNYIKYIYTKRQINCDFIEKIGKNLYQTKLDSK